MASAETETIPDALSRLGGFWKGQAGRYLLQDPPDFQGLKDSMSQEIASYGVISALLITVAQAAIQLDIQHASPHIKHLYLAIWYTDLMANMLCLLASTLEYITTTTLPPHDILHLLARRYPSDFGQVPKTASISLWMLYLTPDKFSLFTHGLWLVFPGLLCGTYISTGMVYCVGPVVATATGLLLANRIWAKEMTGVMANSSHFTGTQVYSKLSSS
ncbi:unnamed protein product [Polarella glacialis]|uniref:Uncharacterized protein n=1 Tax=Polarella glacialis TaxID=89957 RepID=A0A813KN05_POLGL|nr:unnamed protein product [Polarella glacialis]